MSWERLICCSLCMAYYAALLASYALVESQLFDVMGMGYYPPSWGFQLLGAGMALLPSIFLPVRGLQPSQTCTWILYVSVVMPMMFVPYHALARPAGEVVVLPLVILGLLLMLIAYQRAPLMRLPRMRVSPQLVRWTMQAGLAALVAFILLLNGSFHLNLSLGDVYHRRLAARDTIGDGSVAAYAIATLTYSTAPIGLLMGYLRRQYFVMALSIFAFLIAYSCRAAKTDLFMPVFLLGLCLVMRRRTSMGIAIAGGVLVVVLASMIEYLVFESSVISGYLVRRQLFVPSLLTSYYWDFFVDHVSVAYSDRFYGRFFVEPRYDMSLTRLIGYEYFGNGEINANTCFWASAFANLGYGGMLVLTGCLAWLLRLFDSLAAGGNQTLCAAMAGLFAVQLCNGALENCMITGGVAATLATLYLLRGADNRPTLSSTRPRSIGSNRRVGTATGAPARSSRKVAHSGVASPS